MKTFDSVRIIGIAAVLSVCVLGSANAQSRNISFIRDAEIESTIRQYASPIFSAAGLDQDALRIHLVADSTLNAFVLGGQRIFINTGLLQRTEHPGQLMGVIAHEAGHVAAGHLSRLNAELGNATVQTILTTLLGVAVGIVTESPVAGAAVISGGANISQRNILQFTRTMEASADRAALRYLDQAQISSKGIAEFLEILANQVNRRVGLDPYLLTHPEPEARVAAIRDHLLFSRYTDRPIPLDFQISHARMRGKLDGYLLSFADVNRIYRNNTNSIGGRYALAIATFKRGELDRALQIIDGLKVDFPNDPFVLEMEGDALFRNGRIAQSVAPYKRAVELAPNEPLLRTSLARAQLETNNSAEVTSARDNLLAAISRDRQMASAWQLLTNAYGKLGDQANLSLAHAEFGLLSGDVNLAIDRAERALDLFPAGTPGWVRAQDLLARARS
jgi:predicted Zn-dependent protease